ncbi:Permease of the drug/metabolite transporter (DMT) superfamily [Olavius algarvensis associated proteobacterium Delta 3]|nr:Permease of the drug/metabolite transporter (DMT) superfamily [Olavius algarvensis associated proteobacterium Delta 3]CAB5168738.1 Permease of the drug/metabolite transporter (DMT) superfamily [Olavius algarvensis associated proteobacterium Delta 3]
MPYLLLTLTILFWSGNFVLGRGVNDIIPPVSLAFWRWVGAFIVLLPFAIRPLLRDWKQIRDHLAIMTVLAVLSVTFFNTFIYVSLQSTPVANTVLVNAMTPVFIVFVSWIGFRDRINRIQGIGIAISLSGLLWMLSRGKVTALLSTRFSAGDLWTLSAAMSWALYTVLLRKRPSGVHPVAFLATTIGIGIVFLIPPYLWELQTGARFGLTPATLSSIAYVAVFPSVLSFLFWNRSVGIVGANKAGVFVYLMPVFSIALAYVLLGEVLQAYHLFGFILIFGGICLTTTARFPFYRPMGPTDESL